MSAVIHSLFSIPPMCHSGSHTDRLHGINQPCMITTRPVVNLEYPINPAWRGFGQQEDVGVWSRVPAGSQAHGRHENSTLNNSVVSLSAVTASLFLLLLIDYLKQTSIFTLNVFFHINLPANEPCKLDDMSFIFHCSDVKSKNKGQMCIFWI